MAIVVAFQCRATTAWANHWVADDAGMGKIDAMNADDARLMAELHCCNAEAAMTLFGPDAFTYALRELRHACVPELSREQCMAIEVAASTGLGRR